MAIDGVFMHFLQEELNDRFKQSRLEKITAYQHHFLFQFYHNKERKYLKFDLSARFCSVYETQDKDLPGLISTQFYNTLKKHLDGAILKRVIQYKSDRVFIFEFISYDFIEGPVLKELIFESMGKHANLYLVKNGIILDCYKKSFNAEGRHLVPGAVFDHFKTDKKDAKDYVFNPLLTPKEIVDTYMGISLRLAQFLEGNPKHPYALPLKPILNQTQNRTYFTPIFNDGENIFYPTLSECLDKRTFEMSNLKSNYASWISAQIKKQIKRIETLNIQLKESLEGHKFQHWGNAIYESGLPLHQKIPAFNDIPLDALKTLNENAQSFFKKYQKSKRAISFIEEQIKKHQDTLDLLETYKLDLESTDIKDLKDMDQLLAPLGYKSKLNIPKKKPLKPHIYKITDEDATYYIGKNSLQNEYLVHSLAQKNFMWFHVKNASGSHVVVDTQTLSEHVIRKAATFAAYFSSLKQSSSIPVDYTKIKFVSKIAGKPGYYVKYKNEKTIFIDIDINIVDKL